MKPNVNDVYILTLAELTVIAAAKNMKGVFSLQSADVTIDETAVCHALNDLYQKEFIRNAEEEGFVLEDRLRELISGIEEAKSVILLRQFTNATSVKAIYISNRLVATEQRAFDMSAIRIYEISPEELGDYLQEEESEEEQKFHNVLDEEHILSEGIQKKYVLQNEEIQAMGNIVTVVEKMSANSNKVNMRMIEKQGDKCFLYSKENKNLESLGKQEFYDAIQAIVKEELHDIS